MQKKLGKFIKASIKTSIWTIAAVTVAQSFADPAFSNPDKPILVSKTKTVVQLILKSNPSTGYSWFLGKVNDDLVVPMSAKYFVPNTKKGMVGAPGYEIWTFKLRAAATAVPRVIPIQMNYMRAWDVTSATQQTYYIVTSGAMVRPSEK